MADTSSFESLVLPAPLVHVASAGSTNDLAASLLDDERVATPHLTTVVADAQTRGRGRLGRRWVSAPGRSLTASTLVAVPATHGLEASLPWVLLGAALAVRDATARRLDAGGHDTGLKWPNDVVVDGERKLAGLLGQLLGTRDGLVWLVVGVGVNVSLRPDERPTPQATALDLEGDAAAAADPGATAAQLLRHTVEGLGRRVAALVREDGDARASGLLDEVRLHCRTLGTLVTLARPDDPGAADTVPAAPGAAHPPAAPAPGSRRRAPLRSGRALDVLPDGSLLVRSPDGTCHPVRAGDVRMVAPT